MDFVAVSVAALATWRLTHFLHAEAGPWNAADRLRQAFTTRQPSVFACFFCLSVWPALAAALLVSTNWRQILLLWPGLSAAAILFERAAFPDTFIEVPEFSEEKET